MNQEKMLQACDACFDEMISSIQRICQIDSRRTDSKVDAPFGEGVKTCLEKTIDLASSLGFETSIWDHQVGVASTGVKSKDYIALAGHLDVVDLNGTWTYPPFGAEIANGKIYARGVLDNKGPLLSCLYAVSVLKNLNYEFPVDVKVLFGTNEETGMEDMKAYYKHHEAPVFGWTPDCKYPVVYAERGRAVYQYVTDRKYASEFYEFINNEIFNKASLEASFHVDYVSDEFGKNQIRQVKIIEEENTLAIQMIVSYPADVTLSQMEEEFKKHETEHIKVKLVSNLDPVYFSKDNKFVKILEKSYEQIMHEDGSAVTTTGGTYAKVIPNIVPFGPSFKGQKGIGHMPDEWMNLEDLRKNLYIYTVSLYNILEGMKE